MYRKHINGFYLQMLIAVLIKCVFEYTDVYLSLLLRYTKRVSHSNT